MLRLHLMPYRAELPVTARPLPRSHDTISSCRGETGFIFFGQTISYLQF